MYHLDYKTSRTKGVSDVFTSKILAETRNGKKRIREQYTYNPGQEKHMIVFFIT